MDMDNHDVREEVEEYSKVLTGDVNEDLVIAAQVGHLEDVKRFLSKKANPQYQEKLHRKTALMFASEEGHEEIVDTLLEAKAKVDIQNKFGKNALMYAAFRGHRKIVEKLLKADAMVNMKSYHGSTALMLALDKRHYDTVSLLLQADSNVTIEELFNKDINNIENEYENLMIYASKKGNIDIVNQMKNKGLSNSVMREAMYWAVKKKHFNIVKILYDFVDFDYGVFKFKIDQKKKILIELFHAAASKGDIGIINRILDSNEKKVQGAAQLQWHIINVGDISKKKTAMLIAFEAGNYEIVQELIKRGAADRRDNKGVTTLHLASKKGNALIVYQLLKIGKANPDLKDQNGETALHHASETSNAIIVHELLKYGANPDIMNESGRTPVQYAIEKGEKHLINKLLNSPVNLDDIKCIITRANDISSYLHSGKFDKDAFGNAHKILIIRTGQTKGRDEVRDRARSSTIKSVEDACMLEIVAREGSTKDMHLILDIIVDVDIKIKGQTKSERRVIEKLRHSLPHPILGKCVEYVKEKYPWSTSKFVFSYASSLLRYVILGSTFYLIDLVTDIGFVERMFSNSRQTHSMNDTGECSQEFLEKLAASDVCEKDLYSVDCQDALLQIRIKNQDCLDLNNFYKLSEEEWVKTAIVSIVHVVLPILFSFIFFPIHECGSWSKLSIFRIPIPIISKPYRNWWDWKLFKIMKVQERQEEKARKKKEIGKEIEKQDDLINLSLLTEASMESSFQFFLQSSYAIPILIYRLNYVSSGNLTDLINWYNVSILVSLATFSWACCSIR